MVFIIILLPMWLTLHVSGTVSKYDNYAPIVCGSSTEVRAVLKIYFEKSRDLVYEDQELYVLCVQCFEVR